jgi:hypothetical protein
MDYLTNGRIAGLSVPIVLGVVVGGLGTYAIGEVIESQMRQRPWLLPIMGGIGGGVAGALLKNVLQGRGVTAIVAA